MLKIPSLSDQYTLQRVQLKGSNVAMIHLHYLNNLY
uniref:Uncharacterized protein n=1 Tax=Anguilla anguilla TaxID=7936 RepID=A0A0E9QXR0_ANGAN